MAISIFMIPFNPNTNQVIIPDPLNYNISLTPPVTPVVNDENPELSTPTTVKVQIIANPAIISLLKANPNITWVNDIAM